MTLPRALAIPCFIFVLCSMGYGQHLSLQAEDEQLSVVQLVMLDSLAADSIPGELVIPNVFTPNNDQINDYFEVETDGSTVYEFTVFTRTGTQIFRSMSPRIFWDGRNNSGKEMKEGIYYYVIEEEGDSDPFQKAGFMHLFR